MYIVYWMPAPGHGYVDWFECDPYGDGPAIFGAFSVSECVWIVPGTIV